MTMIEAVRRSFSALVGLVVRDASAHCDTEDGPAAADARRALESGNANHALKWVGPEGEAEVRRAFELASSARAAGGDAAVVADRWFVETLVRVHRAGEGAGFDGIKPVGTPVAPEVTAADAALDQGSIDPLRGLVDEERWPELERRFGRALALRDFDVDDLGAARTYMEAYVSFFKYAEGHDHDHHHGQAPGPGHGHSHAGVH